MSFGFTEEVIRQIREYIRKKNAAKETPARAAAMPVKQMESVLTEVMEAEAKEAVSMQGMSCGPDGCHIG